MVECGACIGATVLSIAHKANKVIAIEPEYRNLVCLYNNVKNMNYNNIIIVGKALSSIKGKKKLYISSTSSGHTLMPWVFDWKENLDKPLSGKYIEVEVDTLDEILKKLGIKKVDLIRMNIEGSEFDALLGAIETLNNTKKIYLIWHGKNKEECVKLLEMKGFKIVSQKENIIIAKNYTYSSALD